MIEKSLLNKNGHPTLLRNNNQCP